MARKYNWGQSKNPSTQLILNGPRMLDSLIMMKSGISPVAGPVLLREFNHIRLPPGRTLSSSTIVITPKATYTERHNKQALSRQDLHRKQK